VVFCVITPSTEQLDKKNGNIF